MVVVVTGTEGASSSLPKTTEDSFFACAGWWGRLEVAVM